MDYTSHQHNTTMTRCWGFNVGKLEMEKRAEDRKICSLLHGDRHLNMLKALVPIIARMGSPVGVAYF